MGHFIEDAFYPGMCQYECFNQAAALLVLLLNPGIKDLPKVVGYEEIKHYQPIKPGDKLEIQVNLKGGKRGVYFFSGKIFVLRDMQKVLALSIEKMTGVAGAPRDKAQTK